MMYWPEELQDNVTIGDKFDVTLSSSLSFAEYEIREFILQNVSPKPLACIHHPLEKVLYPVSNIQQLHLDIYTL